ncbi:MAG: hypothetical protein C4K48_07765 [Candidatus Thorarchaeota archaeon]|nr:MAG: hypothetical protein C4K48_07765 [Candidatus Thorarchaeota archaeon]
MQSDEMDREIEIAIVRSFGWSIIDFEAALFQKFLVVSASTSLMTEDMFRKHLKNMQAKGYVAPVEFQGKRAWKRLVIETDIDEPALTPEEVKEFIEKARDRMTEKKGHMEPSGEKVVSESKALAETIIRFLERGIAERHPMKKRIGEPKLIDHVEAMQRALAESKEKFLRYVHDHIPGVYKDMESILDSKGEEALLLSLRVIESGHRAYPPQ